MQPIYVLLLCCSVGAAVVRADGAADNLPDKVRRVPPPGVAIPEADRTELQAGASALDQTISALRTELKGKARLLDLLPDVEIYQKAVQWALKYDEFFKTNEVKTARTLLQQGMERAQ